MCLGVDQLGSGSNCHILAMCSLDSLVNLIEPVLASVTDNNICLKEPQ